ncbi:hypothetical protein KKP04_12535 [Rhodomicrobium sp. Az07]|uniref:hypothetical protein n=1 Tax=Rhodomicrobium sp. Az07 TaxID=2839034 RepID=UPI001BE98166|nr:hypothetical protein [Rhodomicrobium sp. Az07]MBT3071690.1 hypothetical protein [Rhodomicrobium sp. Az07]
MSILAGLYSREASALGFLRAGGYFCEAGSGDGRESGDNEKRRNDDKLKHLSAPLHDFK